MFFDNLKKRLDTQQNQSLFRRRSLLSARNGTQIVNQAQSLVSFTDYDYLGLSHHPEIIAAATQAMDRYGVGICSSQLLAGHCQAHQALEQELAEFTGREQALVFSTGYMTNIGAISSLMQRGDIILADRLCHASMLDGAMLSKAKLLRYRHADLTDLESRLQQQVNRSVLIMSDGVFSMDGDVAPLAALAKLAVEYEATLMIDDAHGFGVLGKQGGGSVEAAQLSQNEVPILVGTLGKSFGCFGAFIAGSATLIESLVQFARTYIYTTAMPPALAEACRASLRILKRETWRRDYLQTIIQRFKQGAADLGLHLLPSETPIQPLLVGDADDSLMISKNLRQMGFLVPAIRPPTVPANSSRLRISLSVNHTEEQVDQFLDALAIAVAQVQSIQS